MLTWEEIIEIMGGDPDEFIECEDGVVMSFGSNCIDDDLMEIVGDIL